MLIENLRCRWSQNGQQARKHGLIRRWLPLVTINFSKQKKMRLRRGLSIVWLLVNWRTALTATLVRWIDFIVSICQAMAAICGYFQHAVVRHFQRRETRCAKYNCSFRNSLHRVSCHRLLQFSELLTDGAAALSVGRAALRLSFLLAEPVSAPAPNSSISGGLMRYQCRCLTPGNQPSESALYRCELIAAFLRGHIKPQLVPA